MPTPFCILAAQNPLEQEGTYPLPEAQLDCFLMKLLVGYPAEADELEMLSKPELDMCEPVESITAEIAACLVYSALHFGDRIGLIGFTDRVELVYPPRRSTAYLAHLPEALLHAPLAGTRTDFVEGFQALSHLRGHAATVFILSDFHADVAALRTCLATALRHHERIPIILHDPLERRWPRRRGALFVEDLETGQRRRLYLSASFRREAEALATAHHARLCRLFQELRLPWVVIQQCDDYVRKIAALFMDKTPRFREMT